MLRTAFLSFFLGLLVIFLGFLLRDSLSGHASQSLGEVWNPKDARVVNGLPLQAANAIAVELDGAGRAVIEVDGRQAVMKELPLLHLAFRGQPDVMAMIVGWRHADGGGKLFSRRVSVSPQGSLWLDMEQQRDWESRVDTLAIIFLGPPRGKVVVESIELLPSKFPGKLFATLSNWMAFTPWQHSSINSYIGVDASGTSLTPVLVAVGVWGMTSLVYLLATLIFAARVSFRWPVVGVLFVLSWIALDSLWQLKLFRQAELTRETFAGRTTVEKRQIGADGALYSFIDDAKKAIGDAKARIFVSSSSDYSGMRGAYYLYPRNVFWQRNRATLPDPEYIRPGDHVLLIRPAPAKFDSVNSFLRFGQKRSLKVKHVLSSEIGSLYLVI